MGRTNTRRRKTAAEKKAEAKKIAEESKKTETTIEDTTVVENETIEADTETPKEETTVSSEEATETEKTVEDKETEVKDVETEVPTDENEKDKEDDAPTTDTPTDEEDETVNEETDDSAEETPKKDEEKVSRAVEVLRVVKKENTPATVFNLYKVLKSLLDVKTFRSAKKVLDDVITEMKNNPADYNTTKLLQHSASWPGNGQSNDAWQMMCTIFLNRVTSDARQSTATGLVSINDISPQAKRHISKYFG